VHNRNRRQRPLPGFLNGCECNNSACVRLSASEQYSPDSAGSYHVAQVADYIGGCLKSFLDVGVRLLLIVCSLSLQATTMHTVLMHTVLMHRRCLQNELETPSIAASMRRCFCACLHSLPVCADASVHAFTRCQYVQMLLCMPSLAASMCRCFCACLHSLPVYADASVHAFTRCQYAQMLLCMHIPSHNAYAHTTL
jgi:hypothetical protein